MVDNPYTKSFVTSSIDRSKVDIQRMFGEGFTVYLNEVSAVRATEIVEENEHVALAIENAIHILSMHNQLAMNVRVVKE